MLPEVTQMFALVRDLANGCDVGEIVVPPWLVQRHLLGPLAARAGAHAFHDELVRATVAWAVLAREIPPVVDRLVAAGVPVAPIKGLAYATGLYSLPAERPMTDVDLLVPPTGERTARRLLAELHFTRVAGSPFHHASVWVRGKLVIDLHRGIIAPGRSRIDLDAVWARTSPGWPAGAVRLHASDELLFHYVHMIRNRLCGPLIHVVDAVRLTRRLPDGDACSVLARADEWRIGPAVRLAAQYCRDVVGVAERPGGWLGPAAANALDASQPGPLRKAVFDMATAGSPAQLAARIVGYAAEHVAMRVRPR
jgi:hypothetical protein